MMDKKKLLMAGAALVTLSPFVSQKAMAATGTAKMSAEVIQAITVKGTQTLNFGQLTTGGGTGTVTMNVAGVRAAGGTTQLLGAAGQEGSIFIKAGTGFPIDVSVTKTSFTVKETAGNVKTMVVDNFNIKGSAATGTKVATSIGAGTTAKLPVGATLNVLNGQLAGVYKGTFTVNAAYQ